MATAKIRVETDVSGVKKGLNQATKDIKSFERTGKGALNSLGQALGLNVSSIEKMSTAFSGAGAKIAQSAGASNKSILTISKSLGAVGAAAGAAAALVAAAWKWMSREADYYGSRVKGMVEASGLKQYRQTLAELRHDHEDGAGMLGFVETVKNKWAELRSLLSNMRRNGGFNALGLVAGYAQTEADKAVAGAAADDRKQLVDLEIKSLETRKRIANLDAQIAEKRRIMMDQEESLEERAKASAEVEGLVNARTSANVGMLQQKLTLLRQLHSRSESSLADIQEENDLEVQILQLQAEKSATLRSIQREQRKLNKEIEAEKKLEQENALTNLTRQEGLQKRLEAATKLTYNAPGITAQIQGGVQAAVDQMELDFGPMLENSFSGLGESLGDAFGVLFSGGSISEAASAFSSSILSVVGGLATQFGQYAISIGVASMAIKRAFNPLDPAGAAMAIGAGVALVALGKGLQAWSNNLSSGGYSTGASGIAYASSSYSSGSGGYDTRELNIKVSGTLVSSGSTLMAVIENEENRRNKTT